MAPRDTSLSKFEEDCKLQEVQCPSLRGGCNQKEFQAFIQQWSLYRGLNNGRDEIELRHQLLNSIDEALKNDMYDVLGSNTSTLSETAMLDVLEKLAVEKIIEYVNYPTRVSKENPVQLAPAQRGPALSKSKRIAMKQTPAHSSPALNKSKRIAEKQPPPPWQTAPPP